MCLRYAGVGAFAIAMAIASGLISASGAKAALALPDWKIAAICAKDSASGQCAAFEGRAFNAVRAVGISYPIR